MIKVLHISPENYTGVLMDYVKAHRFMGNDSRLVTFYRQINQYEDDICLNLPLVGYKKYVGLLKKAFSKPVTSAGRPPFPRYRAPYNTLEAAFFSIRDAVWEPLVRRAFDKYRLWDFDIYHLEGGMGFLRSAKFIRELKQHGKKIVCNYHGLDLRVRGVLPEIDRLSDLNLTCEFDLLSQHPSIQYLFLPFDTDRFPPRPEENRRLRIVHSPRNRAYKGTDAIIPIVRGLEAEYNVELVLVENKTHPQAMEIKKSCDLAIDQVVENQQHAEGGTGYGVNSLETLSLGIPTCTNLTPAYQAFIPDHPFIPVTPQTLRQQLIKLISDPDYRRERAVASRAWVVKYHDYRNVIQTLYRLYREKHWID